MRKFLLAIMFLGTLMETISAQEVEKQTMLKCVYLEEYVRRADQPDNIKQDECVLAMDGYRSAFYSRLNRVRELTKDSLLRQGLSAMEIMATLYSLPQGKTLEIYKNQPENGKYLFYDKILKLFRYEEEIPQIAWQMGEEIKEILGYSCQQAIGSIYGREWTVWFTMDIPISEGPWLLAGLPGLILEASDADGLFHFTAIELGNDRTLSVEPLDDKYIQCTRREFLKQRKKKDEDPVGTAEAIIGVKVTSGTDPQGKPIDYSKQKRKFCYYENE